MGCQGARFSGWRDVFWRAWVPVGSRAIAKFSDVHYVLRFKGMGFRFVVLAWVGSNPGSLTLKRRILNPRGHSERARCG